MTNLGNVTLTNLTITTTFTGLSSIPVTSTLAPTQSITINQTYTITQSDLDQGSLLSTETAQAIFSVT